MELTWEYDSKTMILAKIELVEESISDEFGTQKKSYFAVEDIAVFIYNFTFEVDITSHLKQFEPKLFQGLIDATKLHFDGMIEAKTESLERKYSQYEDIEDY
jgi:hypothetical protein